MSDTETLNNSFGGVIEPMRAGAREGAADAREAAMKVFDSTSLFVSRFVYTTCYTVSYGVVFPATLLARSIPKENAAVRGLIAGAKHAVEKAEGLTGQPALAAPATAATA